MRLKFIALFLLPALVSAQVIAPVPVDPGDDYFATEPDSLALPADTPSMSGDEFDYEVDPRLQDGYYFQHQIIDIRVHHDRTMDIEELLLADFTTESHGFFRTIPKQFWAKRDVSEAQDGSEYEMRYNRVKVSDLTCSVPYEAEHLDSLIDIRVGSPGVWLTGLHSYRFTYRLTIPEDDRVDASDLFFHSVIGAGWDCSTDTVLFRIEFDDEIPAASLAQLQVFCGTVGLEHDYSDSVLIHKDGHHIYGRYCGLCRREAVTVYLPLPDGFFAKGIIPRWREAAQLMALITLLLALFLLYKEWQGDEPVTPVVTFRPSKELTSADIGTLVDTTVDDIDLLSLIPWMAAEGYIRMTKEDASGKAVIQRGSKELPVSAPDYVRCLYEGFFAKDSSFRIDKPSREFGVKWLAAKSKVQNKYAGQLTQSRYKQTLLLMMISFALTCAFACVPPTGGGLFFLVMFLLVGEYFFYTNWRSYTRHISFRKGCLTAFGSLFRILCLAFVIFMGTGVYLNGLLIENDYYIDSTTLQALGIVVAVSVLFASRLSHIAPLRRRYLSEILGLREFILTAEQSRLEALLHEDERYFYRILPYAMVFGLVDKWAEKFAALTVIPLDEFDRAGASTVRSLLHSSDMSHLGSRSRTAAAPPSSSYTSGRGHSSSGGSYHTSSHHSGGYSGGGSGGGGGRRW